MTVTCQNQEVYLTMKIYRRDQWIDATSLLKKQYIKETKIPCNASSTNILSRH